MKSLDEVVATIIHEMGVDNEEVARRKDFLEFGENDIALLKELHERLRQMRPDFVEAFYAHLLAFEETRSLIQDQATLERLKRAQAAYFNSLTAGEYDWEYVQSRIRIGISHHRIRLEPKWYIGAYNKYLSGILPHVWELMGPDVQKALDASLSLMKVVFFDMSLAIDTYYHIDRQALVELQEYAEKIIASVPSGLLVLSNDLRVLSENRSFREMFGLRHEDIVRKPLSMILPLVELHEKAIEVLNAEEPQHDIIVELANGNGEEKRFLRVSINGIKLAEEEARLLMIIEDITERKKAEQTIWYQAYHDTLTGLPNRLLFKDHLALAQAQSKRNGQMVAVMLLDLDRFKTVNDTLGHEMGDQLLKSVAERLKGILREGDTIARFGGDEFFLLSPINQLEDAAKIVQRIIDTFRRPWIIGYMEFNITVSIGIAIYPNDGQDDETLLRNADIAMYLAKKEGGSGYRFYNPIMSSTILKRLELENSLRRALKREEFVVYYQPQVNINSGQIIGIEALVRWQNPDPDRGLVFPAEFISVAEKTGLIIPIEEWVLRTACAQNRAWQKAGSSSMKIYVNFSSHQFRRSNLVEMVARVLKDTELEAHFLNIEITENVAMNDADHTIRTLSELRNMGVQVLIDDFGIGYSSLNYLKLFPINALKIDVSFVRNIGIDRSDEAIIDAIITLAKNLKLKVIAEGVETQEQLAFLKERNCDEFQGYLFCKPLPVEEFGKILFRDNS